ncbi:hypothetical protein [Pandoravirus japonicus]|uniref:Uncharacterized protein n=1 Tax=Pandoravirus japonicus TaxID=2823154 RepID=A0A811BP94_9VIRU|nr:hypothetical protein [Pandoravirus japonicus]
MGDGTKATKRGDRPPTACVARTPWWRRFRARARPVGAFPPFFPLETTRASPTPQTLFRCCWCCFFFYCCHAFSPFFSSFF